MKHLRAFTFDLDDTLWDNRPVLMAAEQSLYDWLCRYYPRISQHYTIEDMLVMRRHLLQQDPGLRNDVTRLRKISLGIAAQTAGYDERLVEPAFAVFSRHATASPPTAMSCLYCANFAARVISLVR